MEDVGGVGGSVGVSGTWGVGGRGGTGRVTLGIGVTGGRSGVGRLTVGAQGEQDSSQVSCWGGEANLRWKRQKLKRIRDE